MFKPEIKYSQSYGAYLIPCIFEEGIIYGFLPEEVLEDQYRLTSGNMASRKSLIERNISLFNSIISKKINAGEVEEKNIENSVIKIVQILDF